MHRLGQARPTFIYRLLYAGTLEEDMHERNLSKEELFSKAGQGGVGAGRGRWGNVQCLHAIRVGALDDGMRLLASAG